MEPRPGILGINPNRPRVIKEGESLRACAENRSAIYEDIDMITDFDQSDRVLLAKNELRSAPSEKNLLPHVIKSPTEFDSIGFDHEIISFKNSVFPRSTIKKNPEDFPRIRLRSSQLSLGGDLSS